MPALRHAWRIARIFLGLSSFPPLPTSHFYFPGRVGTKFYFNVPPGVCKCDIREHLNSRKVCRPAYTSINGFSHNQVQRLEYEGMLRLGTARLSCVGIAGSWLGPFLFLCKLHFGNCSSRVLRKESPTLKSNQNAH